MWKKAYGSRYCHVFDIRELALCGSKASPSRRPYWESGVRCPACAHRLTLASTVTAAPVELADPNVDDGAAAGEPNR